MLDNLCNASLARVIFLRVFDVLFDVPLHLGLSIQVFKLFLDFLYFVYFLDPILLKAVEIFSLFNIDVSVFACSVDDITNM